MSPPAFALVAACPQCGAPLRVRYTRQAHAPFIGCSAYPQCGYATAYEEALQDLGRETDALRQALAQTRRELTRERQSRPTRLAQPSESLDHALRQLLALAHPDKWQGQPATTLAHEVAVALNALRQKRGEAHT